MHVRRILLPLALWILGPAAHAGEPVGFLAAVEGPVEVARSSGSWEAARRDGELSVGDRIRTGAGASAKIVLVDDTLLQVDEETEIRLETWHVGEAATRERSILRQTRGRLRTVVGDAFGGSTRLEVHTPTAVVGVKGTDFETADASTPAGPRWMFCCHGGAIGVENDAGAASPPPGSCVYAEDGRPPTAPFPNPEEPYRAPDGQGLGGGDLEVDGGDFEEVVDAAHPLPGLQPGLGEGRDVDDLQQVLDVPTPASPAPQGGGGSPFGGPALVNGP